MTMGSRSGGGPSSVVGLTGGIASGKSSVATLLAARGAVLIDADVLAREVVAAGTPLLRRIADRFGDDVLAPDGSLDRAALGSIVFGDPAARHDLEALIHPAVRQRAAELQADAPDGAVVVHVIPLLVETGQAGGFDHVIVVDVPESTQVERFHGRDGGDAEAAAARIRAQASRAERLAAADIVIDNSGSPADLVRQVDEVWERLQRPISGPTTQD
jgi:dephospho-CoA kinase